MNQLAATQVVNLITEISFVVCCIFPNILKTTLLKIDGFYVKKKSDVTHLEFDSRSSDEVLYIIRINF